MNHLDEPVLIAVSKPWLTRLSSVFIIDLRVVFLSSQRQKNWVTVQETWDVYVDDDGLDQLSPVVAGGGQQPPLVL